MGIKHLKDLRQYLEKNAEQAFSRTELRDELKQNHPTILDNIDYLVNIENTAEEIEGSPNKIKWKEN